MRETALGAYAHQDCRSSSWWRVQPTRDLSRHPLFQVMLVLQNVPEERLDLAGLELRLMSSEYMAAKFDLMVREMQESAAGLRGTVGYATDLFDRKRVERMAHHFQRLLEGIVADMDAPVNRLPLLSVAERDRLLLEWNQTQLEYPHERCIHELFEQQVERTPQAVAGGAN